MRLLPSYPKAREKRSRGTDPSVIVQRKAVIKGASINFLMLQVLFLGLFCYIMGSLFKSNDRVNKMKILYIDNDQGPVGDSVRRAYQSLRKPSFPTLVEQKGSDFKLSNHDAEHEVCRTHYWAALYTSSGASERLEAAFSGGQAATKYNASNVLLYIWNEARYPPTSDSNIVSNLQTLSSAARSVYISEYGRRGIQSLSNSSYDRAALSVFANPWSLTSIDIQETNQGSRLIYNTLVIILILIQEFFYLGHINGLHVQFKIWSRFFPHRIYIFRLTISLAYTLIGSLCVTGTIWAFRAGWHVNGNQFVLSWMALWLFAHVNFLTLDVFSVWLPHPFVPMALIAWLMFNVTSILLPFELVPGFYRWAYVMPAHEVYHILMDIWSRGCNPQLYYALPILFVEEVTGLLLTGLGVYRRCHYALIAEEAQEKLFQERLEKAVAFQRKRFEEEKLELQEEMESKTKYDIITEQEDVREEKKEEQELETQLQEDDEMLRRQETSNSKSVAFGPSFGLAYRSRSQGH